MPSTTGRINREAPLCVVEYLLGGLLQSGGEPVGGNDLAVEVAVKHGKLLPEISRWIR